MQGDAASPDSGIEGDDSSPLKPAVKKQLDLMLKLLQPIRYDGELDQTVGTLIALELIKLRSRPEVQEEGHELRRIAQAMASVDEKLPDVATDLCR